MKARQFFIILIITIISVAAIDFAIGKAGRYLTQNAKGGDTFRHEYINRAMRDSILIFGSSRAIHHYDPRIIEQKTGVSAYNCGTDGCGILLSYMQLSNILANYKPKAVILDFYGLYDYMPEADYAKYLGWERPYYGRGNEAVDSVFHAVNAAEKWKMLSSAYRYNSKFLQVISDNVKPLQQDIKGFRPEHGTLNAEFTSPAPWIKSEPDPLKLEYIRRFAEKCRDNGVKLIIAVSPYYFKNDDIQIPAQVMQIFKTYGAIVLDHSADPEFVGQRKFFYDTNHLNSEGASRYTEKLLEECPVIK